MNYLAHLFLSPRTPRLLCGALAGDLLSGRLGDGVESELKEGIILHRSIDAFSDSHPAFGASRRRLAPYRHHARVIVDIFYDHLLALHFQRFSSDTLAMFAESTYAMLARAESSDVPGLTTMIERMTAHDWLNGYREVESARRALHYLSRRFRQPVVLETSIELLEAQREDFTSDFFSFFPDVMRHASTRASELVRARTVTGMS
jgi:acyl carrier protein phosphodiesterase